MRLLGSMPPDRGEVFALPVTIDEYLGSQRVERRSIIADRASLFGSCDTKSS
jgi:hypothetical protein